MLRAMAVNITHWPFLLPQSSSKSSSITSDGNGTYIAQLKKELEAANATIWDLSTCNRILKAENSVTQAHCTLANLQSAHLSQKVNGKET